MWIEKQCNEYSRPKEERKKVAESNVADTEKQWVQWIQKKLAEEDTDEDTEEEDINVISMELEETEERS